MPKLVLSCFPGIDLLGRAFEEVFGDEICLVRGPDPLWGGDIRGWHVPAGCWFGVIAGPPCQCFSVLRHLNPKCGQKHGNLIPEFERVVSEAQPTWFVMENVPDAPQPNVAGYVVQPLLLNNRWVTDDSGYGAEQQRERRLSFGTRDGRCLEVEWALFEAPLVELAVTSHVSAVPVAIGGSGKRKRTLPPAAVLAHGDGPNSRRARGQTARTWEESCRLQGMPPDFLADSPFTPGGKRRVLGNAVPMPMGRAIAKAAKRALEVQP